MKSRTCTPIEGTIEAQKQRALVRNAEEGEEDWIGYQKGLIADDVGGIES